jgi:hypothetical protein
MVTADNCGHPLHNNNKKIIIVSLDQAILFSSYSLFFARGSRKQFPCTRSLGTGNCVAFVGGRD